MCNFWLWTIITRIQCVIKYVIVLGFRWSVPNGSGIKWLYDGEASVNKIETTKVVKKKNS
jgi:hypothetical protein